MIKITSLWLFTLIYTINYAQQIQELTSDKNISIRGLAVLNDHIIWYCANKGNIGISKDGGKTWQKNIIKGYENRDFRDIHIVDDKTAIILAVAEPALILKTKDGGANWYNVFYDTTKGMFLDAFDFFKNNGIVIGDPINQKSFMAVTTDYGEHWKINKESHILQKDEAFFASSGSNIKLLNKKNEFKYLLVSGGKDSRLFEKIGFLNLNMTNGNYSMGANSIDYNEQSNYGIIVGGDFIKDSLNNNNCVNFYIDKTKNIHFFKPKIKPVGYKSCVKNIKGKIWISCGTTGVDITNDNGNNWRHFNNTSYNVIALSKNKKRVYFAGRNGLVGKMEL